jgi:alkylation response protein AidB-like acyl-CoA dehydrogenase
MDLALNEKQAEIQALAQRAAAELLAPTAAQNDRHAIFPTATLHALGKRGLMGVNIDPAYGGKGAGVVAYAVAVRQLAAACAGTTVAMMVTNMVAEAIQKYGTDDQKRRYLPLICGGQYAAASFSLSEPGSGSDAASLRATAVLDGDAYVLEGTKAWVTSGGEAGLYLVMAVTDVSQRAKGISAFLVEPGTPGLSVPKPEAKMGLRASKTTQLVFKACRVPVANRLGPEGVGFKIAMNALDGGRVGVSAQACGIATGALVTASRLLAEEADSPSADYAERRGLLADAATELDAGWLLCLRAAALKDEGRPLTREAAMSKLFCTEMAHRACARALDIVGVDAYTDALGLERAVRDVRVTRIYEGTSEVQRIVIAREVLRGLG